ncbi:DUF2809 domain-containing protein [Terrisporobacter petrolearius]|uniref:DUF2809 domain-containing protein n=1 Tax=Terrisporobacter petrolearius TaxID=1460447 RepID=UPI001D167436|nr:DUF2809 domain-containing protein [Terrisporobacter petrolearius]
MVISSSYCEMKMWINAIRKTTIGALVLGHGFLWMDLISYFIGITIAVIIDRFLNYTK